jgi:hypothetical protein
LRLVKQRIEDGVAAREVETEKPRICTPLVLLSLHHVTISAVRILAVPCHRQPMPERKSQLAFDDAVVRLDELLKILWLRLRGPGFLFQEYTTPMFPIG